MQHAFSFAHKVVVVIGGTSGINRGIAVAFAKAGARVAVASRSQEKVDSTILEMGEGNVGFCADVRDFDALAAGFDAVVAQLGPIDVLVSGAAGNFPALANTLTPKGFKSVVDIDLIGTYHVARAAYPYLLKPGASVINISAPQAYVAMAGQVHVCAAKAGVDMVTKTLALEWGCEGVRVNSVIPGPIDGTEGMARLAPTEELREACRQSVPLKRMGTPTDIANACMFLASPMASYINGAIIPVDGGWLTSGVAVIGAGIGEALKHAEKYKSKTK